RDPAGDRGRDRRPARRTAQGDGAPRPARLERSGGVRRAGNQRGEPARAPAPRPHARAEFGRRLDPTRDPTRDPADFTGGAQPDGQGVKRDQGAPMSRKPPSHKGALARLVGACAAHPWRAIGIWAAIIVAIIGANAAFGGKFTNNTTIPGSEAQAATDL